VTCLDGGHRKGPPCPPIARPAPGNPGRSSFALVLALGILVSAASPPDVVGQERRYTVAFANLTEEPGVTLEGTGFTGSDVRESFALAARRYPIDLVFYDNQRDRSRALANAADAVARKLDLYIQYHRDPETNAAVAERLRRGGIPVLAVNYPVPGAPLYTIDNAAAGRIGGEALARFAAGNWRSQKIEAILVGALSAKVDGRVAQGHSLRELGEDSADRRSLAGAYQHRLAVAAGQGRSPRGPRAPPPPRRRRSLRVH
jgi:ABC-type sugar transport system substrate-binding protein